MSGNDPSDPAEDFHRPYMKLALKTLQKGTIFPNLGNLLQPLGQEIRAAIDRIGTINEEHDPEWKIFALEEEAELIENLLGTCFLICQVYITEVVSRAEKIHRAFQRHSGFDLAGERFDKPSLLACGGDYIGELRITRVAAIDALANYFKHREEWPADWEKLDRRQSRTADIIRRLGGRPESIGNILRGAEAIGNKSHYDLRLFRRTLEKWRIQVYVKYQASLAAAGYI